GMDHRGLMDRSGQFVVGGLQRPRRLPLQFGDHPGGDRQAEQVAGQLLDLPLAEAVSARQGRQDGLGVRAELAGGDPLGQGAAGGGSAARAGQAMEPELVDDRLDLGEIGDLMDQRIRVIAEQGMGAAPAGTGPAVGGGTQPLRWHQGPLGLGVSRLSPAVAAGGWCGWLALQAGVIAPVPRNSANSDEFSRKEWLEFLPVTLAY